MTNPSGIPESNRPSARQIATTIELLGDETGAVQATARERLLQWGEVAVDQLVSAAEADRLLVRLRSRAVLRSIEIEKSLDRLASLRFRPDRGGGRSPLLTGAMLLAGLVRTFVPPDEVMRRRIDRLAAPLRRQCAGRSLPTCARLLAEHLHDAAGLRGDRASGSGASVLEPDHLLLHRVLDFGTGLPISLSIVYLLVARLAGLSAAGVAMPDHFLVRLHGIRPVLVDAFHAGRTITKSDCSRYLRTNGYDHVSQYLRDLDDREVLLHYAHALRRATGYRGLGEVRQALQRAVAVLEQA